MPHCREIVLVSDFFPVQHRTFRRAASGPKKKKMGAARCWAASTAVVRRVITFLGIDNCTTRSPNYMTNVTVMRTESGRSYLKGDLIIKKSYDGKLKWVVEAYRCEDRGTTVCEYFLKIDLKEFCPNLIKKDEIWTPYFNSSQPKFTCPIDKKMYRFSKIMLDTDKVLPMVRLRTATEFYWMLKLKILQVNPSVTWMCYHLKIKMDTIKTRQS
ncbi:hypothetical protein AAG570_011392 [Ranatra chinensis]|uniref:Uncharacterized protein n=1 Tax=Ranatra chinensis TaxID=642074 RepID=A0ABD0YMN2_9HEMI